MDGVHDMGGMDGFGKVEPEVNEPVYHAAWEGRVNALQRAMGFAGGWLIDHSRYAVERIPPGQYLTASYYERWRLAIERNCVEQGLVGADEFDALFPGSARPCRVGGLRGGNRRLRRIAITLCEGADHRAVDRRLLRERLRAVDPGPLDEVAVGGTEKGARLSEALLVPAVDLLVRV